MSIVLPHWREAAVCLCCGRRMGEAEGFFGPDGWSVHRPVCRHPEVFNCPECDKLPYPGCPKCGETGEYT